MKYFFTLLFILSVQTFAALPENLTFVSGCRLLTHSGQPSKVFPGMYCAFLPDGRVVSSNLSLTMFDAEDRVLWIKPYLVHHQIKMSRDGKRIITMLSEPKGDIRRDIFAILDLDGNIVHSVWADELFKDHLTFEKRELNGWEKDRFRAKFELSHFNSIHEIPKNSSKLSFLKEGNIIVNSSGLGTCVLSADLKTVYDCRKMPNNHTVLHDSQITEAGKYLYFNNEVKDKSGLLSSAVEEYDPVTSKMRVLFAADPKVAFYSPFCGGVQIAGELLIVSHVYNGAYILNRKNGKIVDYIPNLEHRNDQEIRALELGPFLTARKLK